MSARFPAVDPSKPYVQVFHGNPESTLGIMWERGYTTKLLSTELNSDTVEMEIGATRPQVLACFMEDGARAAQYREIDREYHQNVAASKQRDYDSAQATILHRIRLYFEPTVILETLEKHGLGVVSDPSEFTLNRAILLKLQPNHCFLMLNVKCERTRFRAAQFEWLRKLSANPPEPLHPRKELCLL